MRVKLPFISVLATALLLAACGSGRSPAASPTATPATAPATAGSAATATVPPTSSAVAPGSPVPISPTPIPLPSIAQLSAPSRDVVWALVASAVLFRSNDRGDTWEQRPLPRAQDIQPGEISFADDRHGWVFTPGSPATQCQAQGISLWRTADAGASWEELSTTVAGPVRSAPGIAAAQCKQDVSFVDDTHGFLSAYDPNGPPVIYRTSTGGNSWTASAPLPDPPGQQTSPGGFSLRPQRVQRRGDVLLVGASGRQHTYVYRSADGGATWSYAATVPNAADFGNITFLDATHWWVSGEAVGEIVTNDGGATWQPAPGKLQFAAPIAPTVIFADTEVGYATVRGEIRRTVDGGANWTDIQTPGTVRIP